MGGVPYELRIGRRYLRSTGNRFLSFISLISMLGVAIGVAVLIVVLSVMNGFERELRSRILSVTSHATASARPPAVRIPSAVAAPAAWLMSATTTAPPRFARSSAVALPIPDPPPVTNPTLPANCILAPVLDARSNIDRAITPQATPNNPAPSLR